MNLLNMEERQKLIGDIESESNRARKQWSLRQFEVQSGRIQQYVKEDLEGQFDESSVREMPIVSSLNIQKRIVQKKATVYKEAPIRKFDNVEDKAEEVLNLIYKDMKINGKLNQSNKGFIYQDQSIGMVVPKGGKLITRVFKMHQIDVIADPEDPETSDGFIISSFDRTNYIQLYQDRKERDTATGQIGRSVRSFASETDGKDSEVATEYQYMKYVMKYIVWTKDLHFMMNGMGEVIDPATGEASDETDMISPLASEGIMPFFEVAREKDFEYFVRPSNALTDFTVQFNSRMSDESNNIKMNGYAVGVLKGPSELQPQNLTIGAAMLIKLPTDDPDKEVDFEFVSPSSNIGEISAANDKFLNYFITTEGVGAGAINSRGESESFTSGLDRFIAMVSQVKATKEDYEMYGCAEDEIYEIIKAWIKVLKGSDKLDKKYSTVIPEDSTISIEYAKPEMVQTETEQLSNIEKKRELKLMTKKEAIAELRGVDEVAAGEILKMIEDEEPEIEIPNFSFGPKEEDKEDEKEEDKEDK